jgi:hypothetical protein
MPGRAPESGARFYFVSFCFASSFSRSRTTSPGSACRPSFDFWKIGTSSRITSKRPPLEGTSFTSIPGNAFLSSAANLEARGSYVQTVQYSIEIILGSRV